MASTNFREKTTTRLQKRRVEEERIQENELKRQKEMFASEIVTGPRDIFIETSFPNIKLEDPSSVIVKVEETFDMESAIMEEFTQPYEIAEHFENSFNQIDTEPEVINPDAQQIENVSEVYPVLDNDNLTQNNFEDFDPVKFDKSRINKKNVERSDVHSEMEQNKCTTGNEFQLEDEIFLQNYMKLLNDLSDMKQQEINISVELIRRLRHRSNTLRNKCRNTLDKNAPNNTNNSPSYNPETKFPLGLDTATVIMQLTSNLKEINDNIKKLSTIMLKLQNKIFGKVKSNSKTANNFQTLKELVHSTFTTILPVDKEIQNTVEASQQVLEQVQTKRSVIENKECTSKNDLKRVKCGECTKTFYSENGLLQHTIAVHIKRKLLCPHCDKGFSNQTLMDEHTETHTNSSNTSSYQHQCEICKEKFRRQKQLYKHIKTHVEIQDKLLDVELLKGKNPISTEKKMLECPVPRESSTENKNQGEDHIKTSDSVKYQGNCGNSKDAFKFVENSGKNFATPNYHINLYEWENDCSTDDLPQQHTSSHTQPNIQDDLIKSTHIESQLNCQQAITGPSELLMNEFQDLSGKIGTTKIMCVQCGETCKSKETLERHTIRNHTARTVECPYCKNMFHTEEQLNRHIIIH